MNFQDVLTMFMGLVLFLFGMNLMGFVLSDLITNLERVSDHCSNIAGCVIELTKDELSLHEYYNEIKEAGDYRTEFFNKKYDMYKEKYSINA